MAKYVTVDLLRLFKEKQDTANEVKYMEITKYVDSEGKIKSEQVAVSSNVVPIHVVNTASSTRYYTDNEGVKTSREVTGELGKIYIDLESGGKCMYTYNDNDGFIPFVASVATEDDIEALFNQVRAMAKKIDADTENKTQTLDNAKNEFDELLEEFKIGLVKLGLKGIDDLNNKRVTNPNDFYNSLTSLYNAVKK